MAQIETKAFLAKLKQKNKGYAQLAKMMQGREPFYVEPKHTDMLTTTRRLVQQRWAPVVDRRFGIIFGVPEGFHERFRGFLYCYHEEENGYIVGEYTGAKLYVEEGLGYYISSMEKDVLIAGIKYRPDSFDEELFAAYKTRLP